MLLDVLCLMKLGKMKSGCESRKSSRASVEVVAVALWLLQVEAQSMATEFCSMSLDFSGTRFFG